MLPIACDYCLPSLSQTAF